MKRHVPQGYKRGFIFGVTRLCRKPRPRAEMLRAAGTRKPAVENTVAGLPTEPHSGQRSPGRIGDLGRRLRRCREAAPSNAG
jgi:hypothetical protein